MHSHELTESIAAIVLVVGGLSFVLASIWAYRQRTVNPVMEAVAFSADQASAALNRALIVVAAALSFGAAAIHFAAVEPHLQEFAGFGYAFAGLAVAQVVFGVGLLRERPRARTASIALSVAVVAVWVVSRTTGLPVGPDPWIPERVGLADSVSTLFEIILVVLLFVAALRTAWPPHRVARLGESIYIALVPISGLIGVVTLIAVAALGGDAGHAHG